ncbi:hypothetical protein J6590_070879 [Homalodisca vitripennis]|nr:hypothetical protein J6590_070879 [Homalodisca vitripennis]
MRASKEKCRESSRSRDRYHEVLHCATARSIIILPSSHVRVQVIKCGELRTETCCKQGTPSLNIKTLTNNFCVTFIVAIKSRTSTSDQSAENYGQKRAANREPRP